MFYHPNMIYGQRQTIVKHAVGVNSTRLIDGTVLPHRIIWDDGRSWECKLSGKPVQMNFQHDLVCRYPVSILCKHGPIERDLYNELTGGWYMLVDESGDVQYTDPRLGEIPC